MKTKYMSRISIQINLKQKRAVGASPTTEA